MKMGRKSLSVREQAKQLKIAYGVTFDSESGKQVLRDLLEFCHIFQSSYIPEKGMDTAFREGERNVGLRVLDQLQIRDINELQEYAEVE